MSKYADYDKKLLAMIKGGCTTFGSLVIRMRADSKPFAIDGALDRVVDRRLQALRKQGLLKFLRADRRWIIA